MGIPIANIWLLVWWAADHKHLDTITRDQIQNWDGPLPVILARLLAQLTPPYLRHNLARDYQRRQADMPFVRGKINMLRTESRQLTLYGRVACSYFAFNADTASNRYLLRALMAAAKLSMGDEADTAQKCRILARQLQAAGVSNRWTDETQLFDGHISRRPRKEQAMFTLARLILRMAFLTEQADQDAMIDADRAENSLRTLFEKAILGFFQKNAGPEWAVRSPHISWQITKGDEPRFLPRMKTDIVLENKDSGRCIIIDTKFTKIIRRNHFGTERWDSSHLYQIFAYVMNWNGPAAEGLLLYPAIDMEMAEQIDIKGHLFSFRTVNLGEDDHEKIEASLNQIIAPSPFEAGGEQVGFD